MLISDQLRTIKQDLQTLETFKNTLSDDMKQTLETFIQQAKKDIQDFNTQQNLKNLTTLETEIKSSIDTKQTTLQDSINTILGNVESKLKESLGEFASTQLIENISQAKQEAIASINTQKIAQDIARDESLKGYITNLLHDKVTQTLETLNLSDDIKQVVLENLGRIPIDTQKIATLQLQSILPTLQENINQTLQENLQSKLDTAIQEHSLEKIIEPLIEKHAKDIVGRAILHITNYNTTILINALSQRHTYALIMDIAHKLSNDSYLEDLEQQKLKNNTYLIK